MSRWVIRECVSKTNKTFITLLYESLNLGFLALSKDLFILLHNTSIGNFVSHGDFYLFISLFIHLFICLFIHLSIHFI